MEKTVIFITIFILCWVVYSIIYEKEQFNAYLNGKSTDGDSINKALRKLQYCITYDTRTIKWRRSLIVAFILTWVIFLLVLQRLPSAREFILTILIILLGYSFMWWHYSQQTGEKALKHCNENIVHIKSLLKKNHNFILSDSYLKLNS